MDPVPRPLISRKHQTALTCLTRPGRHIAASLTLPDETMTESTTRKGDGRNAQRMLSLVTMAVGVLLLVFMITVEDEPGALPLALLVGGSAWFMILRRRTRSINTNERSP